MKLYKTKNEWIERFDSIQEFTEVLKSRKSCFAKHASARDERLEDEPWSGTVSYDEAEELLKTGCSVIAEKLTTECRKYLQSNTRLSRMRPKMVADMVGFAPIVPNVIRGYPLAMFNTTKVSRPSKKKCVRLVLENVAYCKISPADLLRSGSVMLNFANFLEKCGVRTEIYITPFMAYTSTRRTERYIGCVVKVKDFKQLFNFQKLSYAIAHVGMFRRQGFRYVETVPAKNMSKSFEVGYGRPCKPGCSEKKLSEAKIIEAGDLFIDYAMVRDAGFNVMELVKKIGFMKV